MSKDTTGTRRCERGTVPGIPKVVSRHVNVMLSVKAVCQGKYQCLGIRPLSSEEKYLIICMETPTICITFMLLGAACCHAEQHISRSGHASRPHQTLAAGSQQSAVDGWHQQQIWHMIQLENVEAVMRSSAGGRMTADDERRQQLMQHAAAKNIVYQPCTWYMRGTYSSTAVLCTYFVLVRINVKSNDVLLLLLVPRLECFF